MLKDSRFELYQVIKTFVQEYLEKYGNIRSQSVINVADIATIDKLKEIGFHQDGKSIQVVINEMLQNVYSNQAYLQHPRCFAFIPSPVSPLSWLGDIMTSAFNPHGGSWLESSGASCIEQEMINWLCKQANYPDTAGGIFLSGGSMANLTALAAARQQKLAEGEYGNGVVYVSEQTHSSVAKGLRILGFRADQVRKLSCDDNYRLKAPELEKAVREDKENGRIPLAVVATAGTTNTGSIDPISNIADICETFNLWLHVDGAYGASILVSEKYKHLLNGISRSDSISWDAHKWLMQTYSCSALLVRDKQTLLNCFSTNPEYLKDASVDNGQVNFWDFGPELTRPARSLKLWLTIQVLGTKALGEMVEHGIQLAEWAQDEIQKHKNWEILSPAQLAIINFRYAPAGFSSKQLDTLNHQISQCILEDGYACVLTTQLKEKTVLRLCAIHPETTEEDIRSTIQLLSKYAIQITSDKNVQ